MTNLFDDLPRALEQEIITELLDHEPIRIERIVSHGQTSPEKGWYDQSEHEWVLVLEGAAVIAFDDGSELRLNRGDYLNIPAHEKHRVKWTDPDQPTVWLAVLYR